MNPLFNVLRFLLIAAGIVFAVEWWLHPDHHYDILLGISVAVLALVEFLRGLWESKKKKDAEQEATQATQGLNDKLDAALAALKTAQTKAQLEPPKLTTSPAPSEDPKAKRFTAILELRKKIEQLIRDYAKETKADSNGTPDEVLSRLNMPSAFRDGTMLFLENTRDLVHQSDPMLDWAVENGNVYIGALKLMVENAKKPAP